ncbi:MAG: nucleotidyl transferase AbiEii/AbiGii toxin family protein [Parachlamydiales bacterium]
MSKAQEQSVKERLRTLAREGKGTFAQLWQNLILERFLARLCRSEYKEHFILKGGNLLARYIPLGRETKDLDFLVNGLANSMDFVGRAIDGICAVHLTDGFSFERVKITELAHPQG